MKDVKVNTEEFDDEEFFNDDYFEEGAVRVERQPKIKVEEKEGFWKKAKRNWKKILGFTVGAAAVFGTGVAVGRVTERKKSLDDEDQLYLPDQSADIDFDDPEFAALIEQETASTIDAE